MTALTRLMVGRARDYYEVWEEEYNEEAYSITRRKESCLTKGKGDPLDIRS